MRITMGYDSGEPIFDHDEMQHYFLAKTKKSSLNPLDFESSVQTEDDLFDILECAYQFLKDYSHDKKMYGAFAFLLNRDALNSYGYEMSLHDGVIRQKPEDGMDRLVNEEVPLGIIQDDEVKIGHAIDLFFKRNASDEDKKSAIKVLYELFEVVCEDLKKDEYLKCEAEDISKFANHNSGIRHILEKDKTKTQERMEEPYLTWFFYKLLNTIKTYLKAKKPTLESK